MTNTQITQLEVSHNLITEGIVTPVKQGTNIELGEDTPLFRGKLQKFSIAIHYRRHQERSRHATTNQFCQELRLGGHQNLIRAMLVQHPEQTTCARSLFTDR